MMTKYFVILFYLLLICCLLVVDGTKELMLSSLISSQGKCRGLWRNDKLVGKCFGLSPYKAFIKEHYTKLKHIINELQVPVRIDSASDCRNLCCNLGLECVTWQYHPGRDQPCKIGGPVRVGMESGGVANWCEPLPPATWSGYRLKRSKSSGNIDENCNTMRESDVPHQCFGLGPERRHPVTRNQLTVPECEAACCADSKCEIWQAIEGRGCFYNRKEGISCGEKAEQPYIGGRKCIPGFCGSLENERMILARFNMSSA